MPNRFLAAFLWALALALPAHATSVLPLYLDEIVGRSALAFEGTCLENRTEREPGSNLIVTYTTFGVRDSLKGGAGKTHVIKQIGGELPAENIGYRIQGVPKFVPGEDYVVFLPGVSTAGFSSPVGLSQGRFGVRRENGVAMVSNGRDFNELLDNLPVERIPRAVVERLNAPGLVRHLDLETFKQLVRELARSAK